MACAPVRKGLVVVEESLTKVEEVAMPLPVTKDLQQGGRASPLDQGAKRIVHAGLVEPLAQAGHLFRRGVQARHVLRLLQAREKLYLAELDRLKTAGGRELGAEGEKVLRRHRLEDGDLLDQPLPDDLDAREVVACEEQVVGLDPLTRGFRSEERRVGKECR